jgi:hypothetical protein
MQIANLQPPHVAPREPFFDNSTASLPLISTAPERVASGAGWQWHRALWGTALIGSLLCGAGFRLVYVNDIEYKGDERWTYYHARQIIAGQSFPLLGMPSSAGMRNPGLSLWVFAALGKITGLEDPRQLARGVQVTNILAILALAAFALYIVPREEREPWLWATALVSLNPLAVLFHRKIWPPCLLPIFTMFFLMAWWRRDRRGWAFAWGLVGACLGQIHMAGFFFAGGFAAWALLFDRKRVAWASWLFGTCLGAIPLIPWMIYMLSGNGLQDMQSVGAFHLPDGKFWMRWITEPFGISLEYALGDDFSDYLTYPVISGDRTYLIGALHVLLVTAAIAALGKAAKQWWLDRASRIGSWPSSPTDFTLSAAFWGYGILLTASTLPVTRHYLVIVFPLSLVWLARVVLPRTSASAIRSARAILLAVCLLEGCITASFLGYVHTNQRAIQGDYWAPLAAQTDSINPWKDVDRAMQQGLVWP